MEIKRKPFQGLLNIVQFNWHFYVIAIFAIIVWTFLSHLCPDFIQNIGNLMMLLGIVTILCSLLVSYYIYDLSNLYQLPWSDQLNKSDSFSIANINAGFDETSEIILSKFPNTILTRGDFYDEKIHTEVSIKRARKKYPQHQSTQKINTSQVSFPDQIFDIINATMAIHEIRDHQERTVFLKELNRTLKNDGQIFITEHLRDWKNFLAYNIGFLHFHSDPTWRSNFKTAGLELKKIENTTPFISTYTLTKHAHTL